MNLAIDVVLALLLVAGAWLLAMKAVPWIFVRLGRLLGLRMRLNPLTERRVKRFRAIKRGYWSFVLISTVFVLSLFLELFMNKRALYIRYEDHVKFPAVAEWVDTFLPFVDLDEASRAAADEFGLQGKREVDYRRYARWVEDPTRLEREADAVLAALAEDERQFRQALVDAAKKKGETYDPTSPLPEWKEKMAAEERAKAAHYRALAKEFEAGKASIVMPLHPYSPGEQLLDLPGVPPHRAFGGVAGVPLLGTDFEGKDVLSQLFYAFRISFAFALLVAFVGYAIGVTVGAIMGYFGGWVDILVQRFIEIWSSIPFLFTLMILGSIYRPGFLVLAALLIALRSWLGITYTIRGEYYREKSRDYVQAARALGARSPKIMGKHILPNSLVPVVTFLPFQIVAFIGALVSLDFLGFGLPPGTPSWGRLLQQGADNIANHPELVFFPILALAATLFCVVMIGEAVREAFDPKLYSRLR
ncbi:MAG: ABC transporter permease subunit [Planctomycetota bacterium]